MTSRDDEFIVHTPQSMHLPELSPECWRCLRTALEELAEAIGVFHLAGSRMHGKNRLANAYNAAQELLGKEKG